MAHSATHPAVVEVTEANFAAEIERSPLPVFVDFWAPWCGPCRALEPLFEQMAEAYRDQIRFTKINADDNKALVRRFNVRGLPTLLLFRDGQVIETFNGARSKSGFTNLLDRHVQRPITVNATPARALCAFHGDAALRGSVVTRLRDHIHAGSIVKTDRKEPICDMGRQRYSLMGAALNNADISAFEKTLGIPAQVGRLQESVHGLLLRSAEGNDGKIERLQPPHEAWPLDWWQAIPPDVDLQPLPSRFIAWLLQERSAEIYPYAVSEEARGLMASLAELHSRSAHGDAPTDEEWRAARSTAGDLIEREKAADQEANERTPRIALSCFEMLAWPSHELGNALPEAVLEYLSNAVSSAALRRAYSPEQWMERNALQKAFFDKADSFEKAFAGKFEKPADVPAEVRKELEELQGRMMADAQRRRPFEAAVTGKATVAYAERLHAGLMQALKDTVQGT